MPPSARPWIGRRQLGNPRVGDEEDCISVAARVDIAAMQSGGDRRRIPVAELYDFLVTTAIEEILKDFQPSIHNGHSQLLNRV